MKRFVLAALALLVPLHAATFTVDTLDDQDGTIPSETSLREAIAAAAEGDTILFDPSLNGGTITLQHGFLPLAKSLEIDATALARGITLDGPIQLHHSTVAFNKGIGVVGATTLTHSIVAANEGSVNIGAGLPVTSGGHNILGDPAPSYAVATDVLTDDPQLFEPMRPGGDHAHLRLLSVVARLRRRRSFRHRCSVQ